MKSCVLYLDMLRLFATIAVVFLFNSSFSVENLHPYYHLWYLPMLAGIYLIIPLLKKIVSDTRMTKYYLGCYLSLGQIP